jgi:hypothetical protein
MRDDKPAIGETSFTTPRRFLPRGKILAEKNHDMNHMGSPKDMPTTWRNLLTPETLPSPSSTRSQTRNAPHEGAHPLPERPLPIDQIRSEFHERIAICYQR